MICNRTSTPIWPGSTRIRPLRAGAAMSGTWSVTQNHDAGDTMSRPRRSCPDGHWLREGRGKGGVALWGRRRRRYGNKMVSSWSEFGLRCKPGPLNLLGRYRRFEIGGRNPKARRSNMACGPIRRSGTIAARCCGIPTERGQRVEPRAVDFAVYRVSDMARSVEFYRDVLALEYTESPSDYWSEFTVGSTTIALQKPGPGPKGLGCAVAIAVEDVQETVAELRAKGVRILREPGESRFCHFAVIQDPDGNSVWLHRCKDDTHG